VNNMYTMTKLNGGYVPRGSEDQLQASPPGTNGTSRRGLHDRSFQQGIQFREAQVRTGDSRYDGGPDRRPQRWSQPLPTSRLLVKWPGWGRGQNNALEQNKLAASVILGYFVLEWLSHVD
jgi:hypothetical protein